MNKLPLLIIVVVLLFVAVGGGFVLFSRGDGMILGRSTFNGLLKKSEISSNSAEKIENEMERKEVPMVKPTESIVASMIPLTISSPVPGTTVVTSTITLTGTTKPGSDVFVNDVETKSDSKGNFKVTLKLEEGENYILVFANDENGNFAQNEIMVNYQAK